MFPAKTGRCSSTRYVRSSEKQESRGLATISRTPSKMATAPTACCGPWTWKALTLPPCSAPGLRGMISFDAMDPEFAAALCRAYNNWLADYCNKDPERLKGAALISLHSIDLAVKETRRAVTELGDARGDVRAQPHQWQILSRPRVRSFVGRGARARHSGMPP